MAVRLCPCSYTDTARAKVKDMTLFMVSVKTLRRGAHHPRFQSASFSSSTGAHRFLMALGCKVATVRTDPCYRWVRASASPVSSGAAPSSPARCPSAWSVAVRAHG